jgi:hypothetical protein
MVVIGRDVLWLAFSPASTSRTCRVAIGHAIFQNKICAEKCASDKKIKRKKLNPKIQKDRR